MSQITCNSHVRDSIRYRYASIIWRAINMNDDAVGWKVSQDVRRMSSASSLGGSTIIPEAIREEHRVWLQREGSERSTD